MDEQEITGLTLPSGWGTDTPNRPDIRYLRPDGDRAVADSLSPVPMIVRRLPNGKVAARFKDANRWLSISPTRELFTRPSDHKLEMWEEFVDDDLHDGSGKTLIHWSGLTLYAERRAA